MTHLLPPAADPAQQATQQEMSRTTQNRRAATTNPYATQVGLQLGTEKPFAFYLILGPNQKEYHYPIYDNSHLLRMLGPQ